MSHAKSSRVIGQFLDIAIVPSFELEKERHAQDYLLRSDSLTKTREWILRDALHENDFIEKSGQPVADDGLLRFTPIDISWLESQEQRKRRAHSTAQTQGSKNLSQLLRNLGDYF